MPLLDLDNDGKNIKSEADEELAKASYSKETCVLYWLHYLSRAPPQRNENRRGGVSCLNKNSLSAEQTSVIKLRRNLLKKTNFAWSQLREHNAVFLLSIFMAIVIKIKDRHQANPASDFHTFFSYQTSRKCTFCHTMWRPHTLSSFLW